MPRNYSPLKADLLALTTCVVALPIAWKLDAPSSCFLLAAMVGSLYGGRRSGYLAAVFGTVLFYLIFLAPRFSLFHPRGEFLRLLFFIAATVLATELIAARYRSEESLRQTQAKLAQATQSATMAEFSASVIHEISQPLSAVVAHGQACLRWLQADPPEIMNTRSSVERIVRDGKDAASIIAGLRTLFRRSPLKKAPIDLRQVVNEVVSLVRGRAEKDGITVEVQLPKDLPTILADRIQLQQVLMNLVLNGMESMHGVTDRPKTLTIHSRGQDGMLLTEIRDQGIGIKDFNKVFETFFTTKENGMGMGLSICRSIIEAHEGRLWGTPGPLAGTTFSFTIPVFRESVK
jgi:C4-dicarboxylate-specific signal transduction histidine kinase